MRWEKSTAAEFVAEYRARLDADPDTAHAFDEFILAKQRDPSSDNDEWRDRLDELLVCDTGVLTCAAMLVVALTGRFATDEIVSADEARILAVSLHRESDRAWGGYGRYVPETRLSAFFDVLLTNPPPFSDREIAYLFDNSGGDGRHSVQIFELALRACEAVDDPPRLVDLAPVLQRARPRAYGLRMMGGRELGEWYAPRLRALVGPVVIGADGRTVDLSPIVIGDPWSRSLVERLSTIVSDTALAGEVIAHLASATTGPAPTKKWRTSWSALRASGDEADALIDACIEAFLVADPVLMTVDYHIHWIITTPNVDALRGAVWALAESSDDATVDRLLAVLRRRFEISMDNGQWPTDKVASACIAMLGRIGSPAALVGLQQFHDGIRHQGLRKQITRQLLAAAGKGGIRLTRLTEGSIPDHGLDGHGTKTIRIGDAVARISIGDHDKPIAEWTPAEGGVGKAAAKRSKPRRTPPVEIVGSHPDEIREHKAEFKHLAVTVATERSRLEALIGEDDPWPFDAWDATYRAHPVTGHLARRLAWRVQTRSDEFVGFPMAARRTFIDHTGKPRTLGRAKATVRPWHPMRASPVEIQALRRVVVGEHIRQPFKQAFREVYPITPAEIDTGTSSTRFAGHILRYRQAYALMKQRGWATNYLGNWDSGAAGTARRTFDDAQVTAQFLHDPIDTPHGVDLCATGRVCFIRAGDREETPLPLAKIDPVVFSETMRDVDMFISVASIGNDPTWCDDEENGHADYWQDYAFGELSPSAQSRREALGEMLPKLKIADRCKIEGRNLVVRGDLDTYRIQLGSGNVLTESGRYVCIVTGSTRVLGKVFLPFEDGMLGLVLSKAIMLAADAEINDPAIRAQLSG